VAVALPPLRASISLIEPVGLVFIIYVFDELFDRLTEKEATYSRSGNSAQTASLERCANICNLVAGQDGARGAIADDANEAADVCGTPIGDIPHC
jgi:hypothetical protein